ncbi:MAG: hypothetical protein SVY53_01520 [Chloroflexota bacterium]|nr:hypothetical protein [Chloroflexota bacterium]
MFVPVFPRLSPELTPRVEQALVKTKNRQLADQQFADFMTFMIGNIYKGIVYNARVKPRFDNELPLLTGNSFIFHIEPLIPWIMKVEPVPQVLSFQLASGQEMNNIPGFSGEFDAMKLMVLGHEEPIIAYHSIVRHKVKVINASPSNPAVWFRSLFSLTGPTLDRKDLVDSALAEATPLLSDKLREMGC